MGKGVRFHEHVCSWVGVAGGAGAFGVFCLLGCLFTVFTTHEGLFPKTSN